MDEIEEMRKEVVRREAKLAKERTVLLQKLSVDFRGAIRSFIMAMSISKQLEAIKAAEEAKAELAKAANVVKFARSQGFKTIKDFSAFLKGIEGSEDEVLKYAPKGEIAPEGNKPGRINDENMFRQMVKEGKKAKEIAAFFGVSEGAVNARKGKLGLSTPRKKKK